MEKFTNNEIRKIIGQTHVMDRADQLTIDLLLHYAFVLHEDVTKLTDKEIQVARDYANNYLKTDYKWQNYYDDFMYFVNQQIYNKIIGTDYNKLEKEIYDFIYEYNAKLDRYNWNYDIYYSKTEDDYLYIAQLNSRDYLTGCYNIKTKEIKNCKVKLKNNFIQVGNIDYYSYGNDDLDIDNIKI